MDWAHSQTVVLHKLNYTSLSLQLVVFQSSPVEKRMEEGKQQESTIFFAQLALNIYMVKGHPPAPHLVSAVGKGADWVLGILQEPARLRNPAVYT